MKILANKQIINEKKSQQSQNNHGNRAFQSRGIYAKNCATVRLLSRFFRFSRKGYLFIDVCPLLKTAIYWFHYRFIAWNKWVENVSCLSAELGTLLIAQSKRSRLRGL